MNWRASHLPKLFYLLLDCSFNFFLHTNCAPFFDDFPNLIFWSFCIFVCNVTPTIASICLWKSQLYHNKFSITRFKARYMDSPKTSINARCSHESNRNPESLEKIISQPKPESLNLTVVTSYIATCPNLCKSYPCVSLVHSESSHQRNHMKMNCRFSTVRSPRLLLYSDRSAWFRSSFFLFTLSSSRKPCLQFFLSSSGFVCWAVTSKQVTNTFQFFYPILNVIVVNMFVYL